MFFFPGIRRLPFYARFPISLVFVYGWMNWGRNYGRDLVRTHTRSFIENWERDVGVRHWQTAN